MASEPLLLVGPLQGKIKLVLNPFSQILTQVADHHGVPANNLRGSFDNPHNLGISARSKKECDPSIMP
jgi:hypothetical protein